MQPNAIPLGIIEMSRCTGALRDKLVNVTFYLLEASPEGLFLPPPWISNFGAEHANFVPC